MPEFGFTDTIVHAQSYYAFQNPKIVNQYAAMPSLHFGWDLLVAIAIGRQRAWPPGADARALHADRDARRHRADGEPLLPRRRRGRLGRDDGARHGVGLRQLLARNGGRILNFIA